MARFAAWRYRNTMRAPVTVLLKLCQGSTRVLHLWLYAWCEAHGEAVLRALTVVPEAEREDLEQRWIDAVGRGADGLVAETRCQGTLSDDAAVCSVVCALLALDAHHADRPSLLSFEPCDRTLPPPLTEGPWYLLPPAAFQPNELARGASDYLPAVWARLGLRCRVVAPRPLGAVRPTFRTLPPAVDMALASVATGADLVVAIASPAANATLATLGDTARRHTDGRVPYRFSAADSDLDDALAAIVTACTEIGAHVLLLPELEVPPEALRRLRGHLFKAFQNRGPLALVVAGSWHVRTDGHFRNRSVVLAGWGADLWHHDKLIAYGIPAEEAAALEVARPGTLALLGIDERGGREDIVPGRELVVCDTPCGRLAVATCLDFCGGSVDDVVVSAGVNLLLVPAMTTSTRDFEERARQLGARAGTWTWVANSGWLRRAFGLTTHSASGMAYRPAHQGWQQTLAAPDPVLVCKDGVVNPMRG